MTAIDDARSKYDIRTILGLDNRKHKIVCPLPMHVHHNNNPSFSIFFKAGVQYFVCHGSCEVTGDVVDLIGYLRIPGYNRVDKSCVVHALMLLSDHWEPEIFVPEREVELGADEHLIFLPPSDEVTMYAKKRGLNEATLRKFQVGSSGNFMTIPNFEEGKLVGIKLRRIVKGESGFFGLKGSRLSLFNYDAVNLTTKLVLIVKGEIPCMLLDQLGYLACAPTGGESSWNKHDILTNIFWRMRTPPSNKLTNG